MPLKGLFYDGQSAKSHTLLLELDTQGMLQRHPHLPSLLRLKNQAFTTNWQYSQDTNFSIWRSF
jgi:hypothetical protein